MTAPGHNTPADADRLPPVHPGEILALDFMEPLGLTSYEVARRIAVDPPRIYGIVEGRRAITADTALRLGRLFNTGPAFWMNLQVTHDLEVAVREIGPRVAMIEVLRCRADPCALDLGHEGEHACVEGLDAGRRQTG